MPSPPKALHKEMKRSKKIFSPYNVPIINDPDLIPSLSIANKVKQSAVKFKDVKEASEPYSTFECFVSKDMVTKIRKCWAVLQSIVEDLHIPEMSVSLTSPSFLHAFHVREDGFPKDSTLLREASVFSQSSAFQASLDDSAQIPMEENRSLRLSKVHSLSSTRTWTPHEINLQKVVHKRGGELHVLTAAATKSRMQRPRRRTRFERLETDLEHSVQQCNSMQMMLEDIDFRINQSMSTGADASALFEKRQHYKRLLEEMQRRRKFLEIYYTHFKNVIQGKIADAEKLKQMKLLTEGQTLESDELLSISLEDKMAGRIQLLFRKCLAKTIRTKLLLKMNVAAKKIQTMWRLLQGKREFANYVTRLKKAMVLQRFSRALVGKKRFAELRGEAKIRWAVAIIQRAYRGYRGRLRIGDKKFFLRNIRSANEAVSLAELNPGHLMELADEIEKYLVSYEMAMPIDVMTVLRAVLYMLNGDSPELITVIEGDEHHTQMVYAGTMSWREAVRLLRRKGKFLRRVRMLAAHIQTPDATQLPFSASCIEHLKATMAYVRMEKFKMMDGGKAVVQFYKFVKGMKIAYDMQHLFPDHFGPSRPAWFRRLLKYRLHYENMNVEHRIASNCTQHLEAQKVMRMGGGEKWGDVTRAIFASYRTLRLAEENKQLAKRKMEHYVKTLIEYEQRKIKNWESLQRTTELALQVAKRSLADYLKNNEFPDERQIRILQFEVDQKTLQMLDVRSSIINTNVSMARDQKARQFDHIFNFTEIIQWCEALGRHVGDLMILKEKWDCFLDSIGGIQFVSDLVGDNKDKFAYMKQEILKKIAERREMAERIKNELARQVEVIRITSDQDRLEAYLAKKEWDTPIMLVKDAEVEEDIECARRDAEAAKRQLKQPNLITIDPIAGQPTLLMLDAKIPKKTINAIKSKLMSLNFSVFVTLLRNNFNEVIPEIQTALRDGKSSIVVVDRGLDGIARSHFNAIFRTILLSLAPSPRVFSVDGNYTLSCENWHTELAPFQSNILNLCEDVPVLALLLGKMRHIARSLSRFTTTEEELPIPVEEQHIRSPLEPIPMWLREKGYKCFCDLYTVIKNLYGPSEDDTIKNTPVMVSDDDWASDCGDRRENVSSRMSALDNSFSVPPHVLLFATLSGILHLWEPPVAEWSSKDFYLGVKAFKSFYTSPIALCELLAVAEFPPTNALSWSQIEPATLYEEQWELLKHTSFYDEPVVSSLVQWTLAAIEFLQYGTQRGGIVAKDHMRDVQSCIELDWLEDIQNSIATEIVGTILHQSLEGNILYKNNKCKLFTYYTINNFEDTTGQMMRMTTNYLPVCVYQAGRDIYVSVDMSNTNLGDTTKYESHLKTKKNSRHYFNRISTSDYIAMLQSNSTEIFEGRIPKFNFDESYTWPMNLSETTRLNVENGVLTVSNVRAKYLQMSLLGVLDGHKCRVEIFEETFGVISMIVYGISHFAMEMRIDEDLYSRLMFLSDSDEERMPLENCNAALTSAIFADRLRIVPSKRMERFLLDRTFFRDRPITVPKTIKLRLYRGPGRLVGEKVLPYANNMFILSIFELHNATDSHMLRICLYDPITSQKVEYRVSPMERTLLFDGSSPLLDQIIQRLEIILVNPISNLHSPALYLRNSSIYKIRNDIIAKNSAKIKPDDDTLYDIIHLNGDSTQAIEEKLLQPDSTYIYGVHFNRSIYTEYFSNLRVSMTLSMTLRGFLVTIFDCTNCIQLNRLVTFEEAGRIYYDKDAESLMEEISNLDDADVVLDLIDDLVGCITVEEIEEEEQNYKNESSSESENDDNDERESSASHLSLVEDNKDARDDISKHSSAKSSTSTSSSKTALSPLCLILASESDQAPVVLARLKLREKPNESGSLCSSNISLANNYLDLSPKTERDLKLVYISSDISEDEVGVARLYELSSDAEYKEALHIQQEKLTEEKLCLANTILSTREIISKIEKSYIFPQHTKKGIGDESRVCWRARMLPSQFSCSDNRRKASVLLKRSARVIRMVKVAHMKVMCVQFLLQLYFLSGVG